jgi:hypothetical protein
MSTITKYNDDIAAAAEQAIDAWKEAVDMESREALAIRGLKLIEKAVLEKREAIKKHALFMKNEALLAGVIRSIDGSQEAGGLSNREGKRLRAFVLDLFDTNRKRE